MDKRLKYYDLMEQLHGKIMSGETEQMFLTAGVRS